MLSAILKLSALGVAHAVFSGIAIRPRWRSLAAVPTVSSHIMHIKKQRLLTPGPTPLLPQALHAMMGSDVHHRTEDFRKIYRQVLTDLKEVYGTANDVLMLVSSGTGALEASVSNFLSPGDKVIVCSAGKFGERWVELSKAFGLDAVVLESPYGEVVSPERVAEALAANPAAKAVFVQASETSTGAAHNVEAMGRIVQKTGAIFVVDAITGLGTMPLDIDGWGLDIVVGGSQKAFMIPPGLAFLSVSPKAWRRASTARRHCRAARLTSAPKRLVERVSSISEVMLPGARLFACQLNR